MAHKEILLKVNATIVAFCLRNSLSQAFSARFFSAFNAFFFAYFSPFSLISQSKCYCFSY